MPTHRSLGTQGLQAVQRQEKTTRVVRIARPGGNCPSHNKSPLFCVDVKKEQKQCATADVKQGKRPTLEIPLLEEMSLPFRRRIVRVW